MFKVSNEMKKVYLMRRLQELPLLREDIATQSVKQFHRCGHQLMGNAQSFGFENLEAIAKKMNNISAEELSAQGPDLIAEFSQCIQKNLMTLEE